VPKITRLKFQKNQERVNLYLDGEFAFGVSSSSVLKKGLKVGQELSSEEAEALKETGDLQKDIDRVMRLVSARPRSEREVRNYLKRKKVPDQAISQVIEKLYALNLLNDLAFANWWVEQRTTFRPKGKRALRAELREKGIGEEIADKATSSLDEISLAKKVLDKKLRLYSVLPPLERRQKATSFLARKGFTWEVIKAVLEKEGEKE